MDDFNTPNLLPTIDSYKSRRALTLAFNEGKAGLVYADVITYLTIEYLAQIKNNPELLQKYDGFMTKTPKDAEVELGLSQDNVRLVYKGLEAAKLITIKTKGQDNRTSLKVDLNAVNNLLVDFIPKFETMKQNYVDSQVEYRQARKEQREKHAQSKLDFDAINATVINNNPADIGKLSNDYDTLSLIYTVNHYYKKYTGNNYFWNAVKFNTLMITWHNCSTREGSEFGLSYAIYQQLNYKGIGSKRPFELRVREAYNHDIKVKDFNNPEYEGVIFDNILKANLSK